MLHPDAKYIGLLLYAVRDDESYVDADDLLVETKVGAWEQLEGSGNAGVFHAHSAHGCGDAALTHYSADRKLFHHVFQWRAPNASVGTVSFRALVKWGETQGGAFFWPNAGGDLSLAPAAVEADDDAASAAAPAPPAAAEVEWLAAEAGASCGTTACAAAGRACSGRLAARVARGGADAVSGGRARGRRVRAAPAERSVRGGRRAVDELERRLLLLLRRRQRRRLRADDDPAAACRGRAGGRRRRPARDGGGPAAVACASHDAPSAAPSPRRQRRRPPAPTPVPSPAPTPAPTLGRALVVVDTRADAWVRTKANKLTENHGTDTLLWVCAARARRRSPSARREDRIPLLRRRPRRRARRAARARLLARARARDAVAPQLQDLVDRPGRRGASRRAPRGTRPSSRAGSAPALVARVGSLVAPVSTYCAWAELDGVERALLNASDGGAAAAVGADAPRLSLAVRSTLGCNQKMYARRTIAARARRACGST